MALIKGTGGGGGPVIKRPAVPTVAAYAPGSRGATQANPLAKVLGYKVAPPAPSGVRSPYMATGSVADFRKKIEKSVYPAGTRGATQANPLAKVLGYRPGQGGTTRSPYVDQYGRRLDTTPAKIEFAGLNSGVTGGRGYYIPWNVQGVMGSLDTRTGEFYVNGRVVDFGGGGGGGGGGGDGGGGGYGPSPDFNGVPSMNLMLWRI